MANGTGLQLVQKIAKFMCETRGFDRICNKVKIVSAGEGKCRAEMVVEEEDTNRGGSLHGGMTATLVDVVSTYALMTNDKMAPGVSVDIHVQYLKGATPGEELVIDASTLRSGKRLAFLEVDISNKKTGDLIAKGTHTKFVG